MDIQIRRLTRRDWPAVKEIYRAGLETGNATFETRVPGWSRWNEGHLRVGRLVAESREGVVGWAALAPVSSREAYEGVAEASLYLAPEGMRKGVGRRLLEALIVESEEVGIWTLQGSVFPENEASLRLLRRCGFRKIGIRRRVARHHGVWRDTVLVERRSRIVGVD